VRWVHSINDLLADMTMLQRGQLFLSDWLRSYKNVKDYAYFNPRDKMPFLPTPFFMGFPLLKALLRKLKIFPWGEFV